MNTDNLTAVMTQFSQRVVQQPACYRAVVADVQIIQQVMNSPSRLSWASGRDAAARLQQRASDLRLYEMAQVFYECYEFFCLRLLSL